MARCVLGFIWCRFCFESLGRGAGKILPTGRCPAGAMVEVGMSTQIALTLQTISAKPNWYATPYHLALSVSYLVGEASVVARFGRLGSRLPVGYALRWHQLAGWQEGRT